MYVFSTRIIITIIKHSSILAYYASSLWPPHPSTKTTPLQLTTLLHTEYRTYEYHTLFRNLVQNISRIPGSCFIAYARGHTISCTRQAV